MRVSLLQFVPLNKVPNRDFKVNSWLDCLKNRLSDLFRRVCLDIVVPLSSSESNLETMTIVSLGSFLQLAKNFVEKSEGPLAAPWFDTASTARRISTERLAGRLLQ